MARLGEEIIYPSIDVKKFFRVPVTVQEDAYLINEGRNTVIKVHDRKLQHSWTLTHPHSFTCPLVYNEEASFIFCVMDNNVLLQWSLDDENLENVTKIEFQESIFCLLSTPTHKLIILFSSGKFLTSDCVNIKSKPKGRPLQGDIVWADAAEFKSGSIVALLSQSSELKSYTLYHIILDDSNPQYYSCTLSLQDSSLKSWCLDKHTNTFLCFCSNGEIISYDVTLQTRAILLTIPDVNEHHLLAIYPLELNHLVVLRSNSTSKESCLQIWDSKYKALKASKTLKNSSPNYIQVYKVQSSILLLSDGELIEIPYDIEKSTLAAAIGKSLGNATGVQESSWKKGKLNQLKPKENVAETMDVSEPEDSIDDGIEAIVQRLLNDGSSYLNIVTETQLVKVLSLSMRHKQKKEQISSWDPSVILNLIFSASFTDIFLMKLLRKLNLEDTILILEILLDCLSDNLRSDGIGQTPSDLQLFSWIIFVLQTHMEMLLLSKDKKCRNLLTKLDKQLSEKMEEYEDLQSLQHMFHVMKMKDVLPKKSSGLYCIDTIDL